MARAKKQSKITKIVEVIIAYTLLIGIVQELSIDYGYSHASWWTFLTYTFLSNAAAMVFFQLKAFNIIKNTYKTKIFMLVVTANIFLTCIIYWTMLFHVSPVRHIPLALASSIYVHLVDPLLVVSFFVWQAFKVKTSFNIKFKHFWFAVIFPGVWIAIQQFMWYKSGIPVYHIFNPNSSSYFLVYLYIVSIAVVLALISMLCVVVNNYIFIKAKK